MLPLLRTVFTAQSDGDVVSGTNVFSCPAFKNSTVLKDKNLKQLRRENTGR